MKPCICEDNPCIHDIAGQFDRLCPSQVDETTAGNGQQSAGHDGHPDWDEESPGMDSVGWYCDGGNVGNPVLEIHRDDVGTLYARLVALPDSALDEEYLPETEAFVGLRINWMV